MTDDEKILEGLGYKPCTCGQECGGMYLNGLYYQPLPIDYNFMFTVVLPALMKKFGTEYVKWRVHGWVTWHLGYDEGYRLTTLKAAVVKMIKEGKDV